MSFPLKQKILYRLTYYKRCIWRAFGFCEKCNNKLNYTCTGRGVCPECSNRY